MFRELYVAVYFLAGERLDLVCSADHFTRCDFCLYSKVSFLCITRPDFSDNFLKVHDRISEVAGHKKAL